MLLHLLLVASVLVTPTLGGATLTNNGYNNVLVAISPEVTLLSCQGIMAFRSLKISP